MTIKEKDLKDIGTEGLLLGCFMRQNDLLLDYYEKLYPHENYFSNEATLFFYRLLQDLYFVKKHESIDEVKINIYLEENPDKKKQYKKIGGWDVLKRLRDKCDLDEIQMYYEKVVKYATLRQLHEKNFPIEPIIDKIDQLKPEQIIDSYEYLLNNIQMQIKGVNDSVILGENMTQVYEKYKQNPDIGQELPFEILNSILRGWRIGTLNLLGMHSGYGKSRISTRIATYIGIEHQVPIVILVNEQNIDEWNQMILSSVVNNIFAPKTGIYVDETKIVTGTCNKEEDAICQQAAKYIEENTQIHFQEMKSWSYNTLKRVLKKHKLRNVDLFIYDTFKPFRGKRMQGLTDWQMLAETARILKELCGSRKKGGIEMGGLCTVQLTDASLFDQILNSTSLANSKHTKHEADSLMLVRAVTNKEKDKIKVVSDKYGEFSLETNKQYYIMFIDKNRGGPDKQKMIYEVNKGQNKWIELGLAKWDY